ncbi:Mitogen-activated protein kinase kinase kinase [Thalictrum thalictroides]|uniref:Mitogen-activated protein kinase kinase kinase n=1 Tax=Thalictrum thalictroides TaxID=46969 RepID=A0A7J6VED8_THATH|nr:Mitogen-activated protein kinase kinase kinase [Thalictrum thalictroides]
MEDEVVGPSGWQIQQDSTIVGSGRRFPTGQRVRNNVSVQTGEEFSMEFLQDRSTTRRIVPNIPDMDQAQMKRGRYNMDSTNHVGYEDLTGILGLSRADSESSYDASDVALRKGCVMEVDNKINPNNASRYFENGVTRKESKNIFEEINSYRATSRPTTPPIPVLDSPPVFAPYESGTPDSFKPGKIKFLCSFGGKILPRPSDAKLRYVGGETRIINIRKTLSWEELVKKTSEICNQPHTIKYQLPGEDLDALISVSSDEDLQNMLEEYQGLERVDGQRLRLFLISSNESESPSSFEAMTSEQCSSEYQYVVALNGIVDPSPRKTSSGPLGQNLDGTSNYYKDSPTSLLPLDVRDGVSPSAVMGMFTRPAAQYFVASKNTSKSPNHSPPYSPLPMQRRDSKGSHLHLCEDHSCRGSNESSSSNVTEQPQQDNYAINGTGHYYPTPGPIPLIHHYSPQKHIVDVEKASKSRGVHFQDWRPMREFRNPPAISRNNSDLDGYVCKRPMLKDRPFHSEKLLSQADDPMGLLSGSNESAGSHLGVPHVFSDSVLQEHGEMAFHYSQEGNTPSSPLDFPTTASPAWVKSSAWHREPVKFEENTEFPNPETQIRLPNTDSICSPRQLGLSKLSLFPEFSGRDEHSHTGAEERFQAGKELSLEHYPENPEMRLDMLNLMDENDSLLPHDNDIDSKLPNIRINPISMLDGFSNIIESNVPKTKTLVSSIAGLEEKPEGYQLDMMTSELFVRSQRSSKDENCILTDTVRGNFGNEEENILSCMSSVSWSRNSEIGDSNKYPPRDAKWFNDESSRTDPCCGSSIGVSCASSWPLDVALLKDKDGQEPLVINSVSLDPAAVKDRAGPRSNAHMNDDILSWSSFQKANADVSLRRDVSVLQDGRASYADQKVDKVDSGEYPHEPFRVEDATFIGSKNVYNSGQDIQLESVIVEDVTDEMPLDFESSSQVVPHVQDEDITDDDSNCLESECEDPLADDEDKDESISDSTIAEIEAGIYGLQIIKNADLEELRELGSGTFGTVYHGKWRGTDVAIKRIKKSCFSGRSSEQERLTKDFWREAQILSKLHHPNVVAFYGVVPDGSGGTLATVTEFMVNGSLRHVLLRKDRALDRRKKLMIAMDAAFGMEYLHSKNIVHFDLKCDNLLVNLRDSQRPICKVGDFGLSRIKRNTLVSGGVRGTLPWMAPELLNGSSNRVSEKVDVFSFGIAMWEILTGEEPYANMHCGAIIGGILNNTLRPNIPDRCDSEWRKLMEECWAPDPSVRPSFTEITNRLRVMSMALQTRARR